jgi:hypothetical protein
MYALGCTNDELRGTSPKSVGARPNQRDMRLRAITALHSSPFACAVERASSR